MLWCCSSSLYGQKNALEYQVGFQQIKLFFEDGRDFNPNGENFTPRIGLHYYHRFNKTLGIKTGLQLIHERFQSSGVYIFYSPTGTGNSTNYDLNFDLLVINIPANIRIDLNQGNPRFFIETGFSLNMYWKERSRFDFGAEVSGSMREELPTERFIAYEGENQIGALANFNLGFRHALNEKSALIFQLFSAFDFSRIDRFSNKRYILHYGVQMGYIQFL